MFKSRKCLIFLLPVLVLSFCITSCKTNKENAEKPQKEEQYVMGMIANKPDDLLILDSDLIVTGKVSGFGKSKWSNPNFERGEEISNVMQTDVYISVDSILYGDASSEKIAVRIDEGEDETTIFHSDGYPDFEIGKPILLFLARDRSDVATDEDYYILVGMKQGKYDLDDSSKAEQGNMKDDASADNAKYVNLEYPAENRTFEIGALKQQIKDEHEKRPNYREERAQKEAEIEERNKELFGE